MYAALFLEEDMFSLGQRRYFAWRHELLCHVGEFWLACVSWVLKTRFTAAGENALTGMALNSDIERQEYEPYLAEGERLACSNIRRKGNALKTILLLLLLLGGGGLGVRR